jgi:hypothetical protein
MSEKNKALKGYIEKEFSVGVPRKRFLRRYIEKNVLKMYIEKSWL